MLNYTIANRPQSKNSFILLNVGTLCKRKAQLRLVALARYLEQEEILLNLQFVVLESNSDDYLERMEMEIVELGFYRTRFVLTDEIADPSLYFRAADLFVFTSTRGEAYPTVLTKALVHDLPILTTPVEGAADIVFHDAIGAVEGFDDLDPWVAFISKMQDNAQYAANAQPASTLLPQ